MRKVLGGAVASFLLLASCHQLSEELPANPTPVTTPSTLLTVKIPSVPTPTPRPSPSASPSPSPSASPSPSPTPSPSPSPTPTPSAGTCGAPLPVVTKMNVKVHIRGPAHWTLDSTPLVGPDAAYCRAIGFTDGRSICSVRVNGAPDRVACEAYAVGAAEDTGRGGPTWYRNGQLCNGEDCQNHPENQYQLWTFKGGHYEACTKDDICGSVDTDGP